MWEFVSVLGGAAFLAFLVLGFLRPRYWWYALAVFVPLALLSTAREAAIEFSQPGAAQKAYAGLVIGGAVAVGLVVLAKAIFEAADPRRWWKK
jgi:O-antigen ligase